MGGINPHSLFDKFKMLRSSFLLTIDYFEIIGKLAAAVGKYEFE